MICFNAFGSGMCFTSAAYSVLFKNYKLATLNFVMGLVNLACVLISYNQGAC